LLLLDPSLVRVAKPPDVLLEAVDHDREGWLLAPVAAKLRVKSQLLVFLLLRQAQILLLQILVVAPELSILPLEIELFVNIRGRLLILTRASLWLRDQRWNEDALFSFLVSIIT